MSPADLTLQLALSDGTTTTVALDAAFADSIRKLPLIPHPCFAVEPGSVHIDLACLLQTRARKEGIESAARYMIAAAQGQIQPRAPISVRANSDGRTYAVVDGNSTVTVARLANWLTVPCMILD